MKLTKVELDNSDRTQPHREPAVHSASFPRPGFSPSCLCRCWRHLGGRRCVPSCGLQEHIFMASLNSTAIASAIPSKPCSWTSCMACPNGVISSSIISASFPLRCGSWKGIGLQEWSAFVKSRIQGVGNPPLSPADRRHTATGKPRGHLKTLCRIYRKNDN